MSWRDQAACLGIPNWQTLFFADPQRAPHARDRAKAICAACPVRQACLDAELEAMRGGAISFGIFGGTDEQERRELVGHGTRHPIKHGTIGGYSTHRRRCSDACAACKAAHAQHQAQYTAREES